MTAALAAVPLLPVAVAMAIALARARAVRWAGPASVAAAAGSLALALTTYASGASLAAPWLEVGSLSAGVSIAADGLGSFMAVLVAAVCLVVQVYAVAYMAGDPRRHVLFGWLSMFSGSMLALALADSLVLLFVAWELVSLASYALIAFHHDEPSARGAATRAFTVTRIGDAGLLVAIAALLVSVGDTSHSAVLTAADTGALPGAVALVAGLGLLVAAIAKSAQLPLSAWLPDAMVAPTPVSALLHSATMVAAGVYLLVRFLPVLNAAPPVLDLAVWVGAATALVGSLIAASAADLKRVLAWSTVAHLGEMIAIVGHSSPAAATFHLTTHALFKGALFLVAGVVQQRAGGLELARLGGLARRMPIAAAAFAVSALALAGIPPLGGFWSEQALLAASARAGAGWAVLEIVLIFLAGAYVARAGFAVFGEWPGARRPDVSPPRSLTVATFTLLAVASALAGFAAHPIDALPFANLESPQPLLTLAAVAAAVAGLGFGAWRVRRAGPVAAFGALFGVPARLAGELLGATGRIALAGGRACRAIEHSLDTAARGAAGMASAAASAGRTAERALSASYDRAAGIVLAAASAGRTVERALNASYDRAGAAALASARATVSVERTGFEGGGDGFAAGISAAGGQLRRLQVGKLYLYTASLFVSALVLGAVAAVIAMF